jgi:myo-inositol-1(or 4)-monophosphatase
VLNPITNECFRAQAGHGATLDGEPAHASARHTVEGCRMLAPKALFEHPGWSNAPNVPWPPMHIEQRNSIAYRLALVGAGLFDAAISLSSKHDWDLAAGDLIVQEAGGLITDHRGQILRYNGAVPIQRSMVAAGALLHPLLIERTRRVNLPER